MEAEEVRSYQRKALSVVEAQQDEEHIWIAQRQQAAHFEQAMEHPVLGQPERTLQRELPQEEVQKPEPGPEPENIYSSQQMMVEAHTGPGNSVLPMEAEPVPVLEDILSEEKTEFGEFVGGFA